MACKNAKNKIEFVEQTTEAAQQEIPQTNESETIERLLFGVDTDIKSSTVLQNNLTLFDWAERNKLYPNFWGRNISGENALTKEEIDFLHSKGCKIAAICKDSAAKETEAQGAILAKKIGIAAYELGIPNGAAIFLEIEGSEKIERDFLRGFADMLLFEGYTPGFKADTDAKYDFDREFSRGLQTDKEIFDKCLVWAVAPSLQEYDRVTTTHLIHPDNWLPFAPSGITREDIAVWQYGKTCHPINDNTGKETTFNIDLVKKEKVITDRMF